MSTECVTLSGMTKYDLAVLGGGSGGYAAALRGAQLGLSVAIVERGRLGGTCLHRGCIPTKAWLHAGEISDAVRHAGDFGVRAKWSGVDVPAVRAYADGVVARLYKGLEGLVRGRGIEVVAGEGRLASWSSGIGIAVGDDIVEARHVVLATGAAPRTLPGVVVDGERVITSENALRLESLPTSAIVLGGGVIGVEFASAWRSLGVEVTVIEAAERLLPAEEPEVSRALMREFGSRGIEVLAGAAIGSVTGGDDCVEVLVGDRTLTADVLLVAVGRAPVLDAFGEAGVRCEGGSVFVDSHLRTSVPDVFAVGDLVAGPQLAHRGFAHGIFVAELVAHRLGKLADAPTPPDDSLFARVTYCSPEVASVGLTQVQAAASGPVETQVYDLAGNGRAQILKTHGLVKVVRRQDGPVVGLHAVGQGVSEIISEGQLITAWEAYPDEVASLSHAHPTLSEAIGEAHLALTGRPLHAHA